MASSRPILQVAALVVAAALLGCRGTDPAADLVLVPRAAERDPARPPRYVLLARSEVVSASDAGAVELWLPLPSSDRFQTVRSLAVEVGPPGTFAVEEAGGDRVLHVASPGPTPVAVRALIERAAVDPGAALPAALREVPPGLEPAAWAEAAAARGAQVRLVHGLELRADGQTVSRRWPEVLLDDAWSPVDLDTNSLALPSALVRLSSAPARATVEGRPAQLRTSYALEERR